MTRLGFQAISLILEYIDRMAPVDIRSPRRRSRCISHAQLACDTPYHLHDISLLHSVAACLSAALMHCLLLQPSAAFSSKQLICTRTVDLRFQTNIRLQEVIRVTATGGATAPMSCLRSSCTDSSRPSSSVFQEIIDSVVMHSCLFVSTSTLQFHPFATVIALEEQSLSLIALPMIKS